MPVAAGVGGGGGGGVMVAVWRDGGGGGGSGTQNRRLLTTNYNKDERNLYHQRVHQPFPLESYPPHPQLGPLPSPESVSFGRVIERYLGGSALPRVVASQWV